MTHPIEVSITALTDKSLCFEPVLFNLSIAGDQEKFQALISSGDIQQISNDYEEQQKELFGVNNPSHVYLPTFKEEFAEYYQSLSTENPLWQHGRWVYYSWRHLASHILEDVDYQLVRTARNKNLITKEEQEKFYNATIGIGGLSVGSSVAFAIVLSGGGKRLKLADMDELALSNTNRVLSGAPSLGMRKVEMAARTIYEMNPYAEVELYPEGLTPENIEAFCSDLDIVIDEIDNLAVKYLIREQAKKRRIPVVMAADNGDNAVIDVERYDLDPETKFFHGRMGEVSYDMLKNLDKFGIGKMITKHVGPENVTERMQQSLMAMGKTIVSWPQLGIAAMVNGAAVAYCVRKILNGQPIENNRALISLDEKLVPEYNETEQMDYRKKLAIDFAKMFGL